jgi:hypothetical protein
VEGEGRTRVLWGGTCGFCGVGWGSRFVKLLILLKRSGWNSRFHQPRGLHSFAMIFNCSPKYQKLLELVLYVICNEDCGSKM